MKVILKAGSTSNILQIFVSDSSSSTGAGLTGLTNASSGLTAYYHRDTDTTATAISLVTMTVGTFTSSGFKEIDSTNMPGWYQFCPPNAAFAASAGSCAMHLKGVTNMAPLPIEVQLVAFDPQDGVRLGLTALPNAAAGANGGLPTGDASARVQVQYGTSTGQISATAGIVDVNAKQWVGGTIPAVNFTGVPKVDVVDWLGVAPLALSSQQVQAVVPSSTVVASVTGAVGSVTGAVGSVTGAVGSVTGNVGGNVVGTVASVVGAVGSVTGNVGGSVASVVGAVGSVAGNVGGSVASVVGAVGSVTGNVGGNVTGSVGSVAGNVSGSVASVVGAVGSVTGNVGGNVVGSTASVVGAVGSVTGNVGGSVASVTAPVTVGTNNDKTGYSLAAGQIQVKKNTALAKFGFVMISSSDHITPIIGATVAATRSIDGGAFASCANAVSQIGNGWYTIDLAAADLNGNNIALRFAATGADDRNISIITQA